MKTFDQINVIPFIDIMLVLLAIVLTTATFVAQGVIPVNLPSAENSTAIQEQDPVELVIDKQGLIYLNDKQIDIEALNVRLQGMPQSTPFLLRVDATSNFEHFVSVADALKAHGMESLSIMTLRSQ